MADGRPVRLDPAAVLHDAWTLFRRDRDVLLRIAGVFLFLPSFALALLVPAPPQRGAESGEAAMMAWFEALRDWSGAHGGWYLLTQILGYWGAATLYALYLHHDRPDVASAIRRGAIVLPRYLLAMALVALPVAAGMLLLLVPGLYVLGRVMMTGPVLLADRTSALSAIRRSMWLSRGAGLPLMGLAAAPVLGEALASQPFVLLDAWMRDNGAANPVALAIVDAGSSLVSMAAGLAGALIALVAYRRTVR